MARVLVVEDEADVRTLLTIVVGNAGHTVTSAPNGEAALAELAKGGAGYDLVVLDLMMPNLDGRGVLRSLDGAVAVIVLSAYLTPEAEHECMALGAVACIRKPLHSLSVLTDAIDAALEAP